MSILAQNIHALNKAVTTTFEQLCFIVIEQYRQVPKIKKFRSYHTVAEIELVSPVKGVLGVVIDKKLTHDITTINDDDSDLNSDHLNGILAEISNTIAGRLMKDIVNDEMTFDIGLPHFSKLKELNHVLDQYEQKIILEFSTNSCHIYSYFLSNHN